jgi:hypothetical protein
LTDQRMHWPRSYAVLLVGEPFYPDARFHQDYIRVIPPDQTDYLLGPRGIDIPPDEHGAMAPALGPASDAHENISISRLRTLWRAT